MTAQPFEFGKDGANRARPRRRHDVADCLHGLAECQAVRESGGARESLGEQKRAIGRLSLRDLLDAAILVEETRNGADDVLAHGFEQKVGGLGEIGKYRADRHGERARCGNDRRRLPFRIERPVLQPLLGVKAPAHRIDAFRPVLVQHEFTESRMTLEGQSKQIFHLAFVPVERRTVNEAGNGWDGRYAGIEYAPQRGPRAWRRPCRTYRSATSPGSRSARRSASRMKNRDRG